MMSTLSIRRIIFIALAPLSFIFLLVIPIEFRLFFILLILSIPLLMGAGWLAQQSISGTRGRPGRSQLYPLIVMLSVGLMVVSTIILLHNRQVADTGFWLFLGGSLMMGLALWMEQGLLLPPLNRWKALREVSRILSLPMLVMLLVGLAAGFLSVIAPEWRLLLIVFLILLGLVLALFYNRSQIRWLVFVPGIALLSLATQSNITFSSSIPRWIEVRGLIQLSHHHQMVLFVAGGLLVVWGLGGGWRFRPAMLDRVWKPHYLIILVIVLIAFVARTWNLEEGVHRFLDEIHYANAVFKLRDTNNQYIFQPFSKVTAFSWLFPYLQYMAVEVAGPSLTTLRIVSACIGTLHVIALYALGKTLFNRKVGMLTAFIFATMPVHIHFSRIGINNIADPFVGTVAILFLVRGFRSEQPRDFVLAGASLALTQYFYEGGRLLFPLLFVGLLAWLTFFGRRDKSFVMPHYRNVLLLIAAFLLLTLPLYYTWLLQEFSFVPRFVDQSLQDKPSLETYVSAALERISLAMRGVIQLAEWNWFFGGDQALLLPGLVPFFLMGVAHSFWRLRRVEGILLVGWLVAAILGNGMLIDSLLVPRYVVVFPVLALLVAAGIHYTLSLAQAIPRLKNGSGAGIMLVLAICFGIYQLTYYFGTHLPGYYRDQFYDEVDAEGLRQDIEDALFRARLLPDNTRAIIASRNRIWRIDSRTAINFWERRTDIQIIHFLPAFLDEAFMHNLSRNHHHAFFIEPDDTEVLQLIQQHFVLEEVQLSPYNIPVEKQMHLYFARLEKNTLPPVNSDDE